MQKNKLRVHHIKGVFGIKTDDPGNLITACKPVEWGYLHNGATEAQQADWALQLEAIAYQKTVEALEKGWEFPDY
jgi:hypothetical protein